MRFFKENMRLIVSNSKTVMPPQESRGSLHNKVIIVTGAAQGLGRNASLYLAKEGAIIVAVDRQEVTETLAEIEEAGGTCIGLRADVSKAD